MVRNQVLRLAGALLLSVTAYPLTASATVIAPVSVVNGQGLVDNLINASGLSGVGPILDQIHDYDSLGGDTSWATAETSLPFNIDFDLGGLFDLTNVHIWNYSHVPFYVGRDTKDINLFLSTDGQNWGSATSVALTQNASPAESVQNFALTGAAQYVRLQVVTPWGCAWAGCETGLGEVRFTTSTVIPEPSAYLLFALGLAGLGWTRDRRSK